jgi:hypothetical protein
MDEWQGLLCMLMNVATISIVEKCLDKLCVSLLVEEKALLSFLPPLPSSWQARKSVNYSRSE